MLKMKLLIFLSAYIAISLAQNHQQQQQQYTTPVPILKQINRHNEDGSYSYGYEAADGSFKIETKYPDGEVQGKYGYVDDQGKTREVEYGASKRGFEPQGTDINVPPPTLNNNNNIYPLGPNEEDDGQYREDPSIYWKDNKYNSKASGRQLQQPAYFAPDPVKQQTYNRPASKFVEQEYIQEEQPVYTQHRFHSEPAAQRQQQYSQPAQQQQQYYQPPQPKYNQQQYNNDNYNNFDGHPATNLNLNTGSYSLTYTG